MTRKAVVICVIASLWILAISLCLRLINQEETYSECPVEINKIICYPYGSTSWGNTKKSLNVYIDWNGKDTSKTIEYFDLRLSGQNEDGTLGHYKKGKGGCYDSLYTMDDTFIIRVPANKNNISDDLSNDILIDTHRLQMSYQYTISPYLVKFSDGTEWRNDNFENRKIICITETVPYDGECPLEIDQVEGSIEENYNGDLYKCTVDIMGECTNKSFRIQSCDISIYSVDSSENNKKWMSDMTMRATSSVDEKLQFSEYYTSDYPPEWFTYELKRVHSVDGMVWENKP